MFLLTGLPHVNASIFLLYLGDAFYPPPPPFKKYVHFIFLIKTFKIVFIFGYAGSSSRHIGLVSPQHVWS